MFILIDKNTLDIVGLYNDKPFFDENKFDIKEVSFKDLFGEDTYNYVINL